MGENTNQKIENYYSTKRKKLLGSKERQRVDQYMAYLNNTSSDGKNWRKWGCYLSERQWGTVRENYNTVDYSWGDGGQPATFPRDQALNRAYRWGEDGIAGISDDHQYLCFAVSMWNAKDPCIKERLYGLTNGEGNHGEDVKEYYFYLDNTPTHSYMKYQYKYPYEYMYSVIYNKKGSQNPYEYELVNTGVFSDNRYFNINIEYAKNDAEDILIKITAKNMGQEEKVLHLLPTIWFRNTWSFKDETYQKVMRDIGNNTIEITQKRNDADNSVPTMKLYTQNDSTDILFTDNETDNQASFGSSNTKPGYFKNGINNFIIGKYKNGKNQESISNFINTEKKGTKASVHYELNLKPGEEKTICLRLSNADLSKPFNDFSKIFNDRLSEANDFYDAISPYDRNGNDKEKELYNIQRQAFSGMLWNKQLFHFVAEEWLSGDPKQPSPMYSHVNDSKITKWKHLYCKDILLMPDKWEYPWFAAWDLAFHTVTVGLIDPDFAKHQLLLMVMEWYMHPNGQIPAYEWDFCNINPPVHAWAALNVYNQEKLIYGKEDNEFLVRIFDKLNMNFTWWVNRVDEEGNNVFAGGFLGLDNIRIIDKDPSGKPLEQADGTAWMAMFCLNMMKMANILKKYDLERKYLQHFIYLCDAMNRIGNDGLWDEQAGFFFDCANNYGRIPVYSVVGLVPLFAIEELDANMEDEYDPESFGSLSGTLKWFMEKRPDLITGNPHINLDHILENSEDGKASLNGYISVVDKDKLSKILLKVLDSDKFLSNYGIRSLAKDTCFDWYGNNICYEPAESNKVKLMGGNSNWRGPIWFPINYLLIESLRKFTNYVGSDFEAEYKENGTKKSLDEVCDDLTDRLINIFRKSTGSKRPVYGAQELFTKDDFDNNILFYEYFHGDNGAGLGASHQTGWTGLVANLIQEKGIREKI